MAAASPSQRAALAPPGVPGSTVVANGITSTREPAAGVCAEMETAAADNTAARKMRRPRLHQAALAGSAT